MLRRFIPIMLSLMLVMTMAPYSMAATRAPGSDGSTAGSTDGSTAEEDLAAFAELEEEDYAPGEAIVVFAEGAVKNQATSLKAARKLDETGSEFGDMMGASGEAEEAAQTARSEVSIIRESLGDDFIIRDTIALDEEFITCLVASEKYGTESLIKKLSENEQIKTVEANTYLEPEGYEYSLNDELAPYAYQVNSPADTNTGGKNVISRGTPSDQALSERTGAASDFAADHSSDDEVVVAVLDSGINAEHEDLQNMLWTNPGNIGLEGEHGFNFDDNGTELTDRVGHGTHCSGIIAAEANNGKGIAGVASGVNVKIMMCAISNSRLDENGEPYQSDTPTTFRRIGAMNYCLKAKKAGVNIVATSNSWGSPDKSDVFDETVNKLGQAGIVTFVAASNDSLNIDQVHYAPAGGDSPYMVTVGSADITGRPAGYTNYGKTYVDLFAPGHNILSTSAWSIYEPSLYSVERRAENTEYYGGFNSSVEVGSEPVEELGTNEVVPDAEGLKAFGAAKFYKQKKGEGEDGGEAPAESEEPAVTEEPTDPESPAEPEESADAEVPEATCELSTCEDKFFTDHSEPGSDMRPASLKVTIHNARSGEEYYLYFPYAKNHDTTGIDNTRYSITTILQHEKDEYCANVAGGEIVKREKDGVITMSCNTASEIESTSQNDGGIENLTCGGKGNYEEALLSWEDSDPEKTDVKETGIGLCITPLAKNEAAIDADNMGPDEIRDITVYIDSLGMSKPGKPEEQFPANTSYELMSGTSMACPAAAGAYAVLTTLYPAKAGQSGAAYAAENRARLLSMVRKTDELKDLCSTGGYIDMSLVENAAAQASITDAVCNVKAGTLTLHGIGLTSDLKLSCRSLASDNAAEKSLPSGSMKVTFAKDGKTVTISGAKELFGRYIEFIARKGTEVQARGAFFTVKGQSKPKKVLTEEHKETIGKEAASIPPRQLLTDSSGKTLYAYQMNSYSLYEETAGVLYKYDGAKFVEYPGTRLKDALFDYYEKKLGYDRHQITRGLVVTPQIVRQPICEGNVIYDFVSAEYTPYLDAEEEKIEKKTFLASLNYTAGAPAWTFREVPFVKDNHEELEAANENELTYCAMGGKIYCFGTTFRAGEDYTDEDNATFVYALDIKKGTWERKNGLKGTPLRSGNAYYNNGKIWLMFGFNGMTPSKAVYSFDGATWKKAGEIPALGRSSSKTQPASGNAAPVRNGFILFDYSVEGAGNVSLFNTATGKCSPLYYTIGDGLSDASYTEGGTSAIETVNGIYYCMQTIDTGQVYRVELYQIPKTSYAYAPRYMNANPAKITKKNLTVKAKTLKKKSIKKKAITVKSAKGKVTYQRVKIKCSKKLLKAAKKKIKVNTKTGKVTIKKGLKKGKYTVTVRVKAAGDLIHKPVTKKVTFRIRVR